MKSQKIFKQVAHQSQAGLDVELFRKKLRCVSGVVLYTDLWHGRSLAHWLFRQPIITSHEKLLFQLQSVTLKSLGKNKTDFFCKNWKFYYQTARTTENITINGFFLTLKFFKYFFKTLTLQLHRWRHDGAYNI